MSSIIEGYNYDIFISYRQKDNKGDRWVSEFVDSLKTELESTFKEEISVYFDINPTDGLLETDSVDKSLKDKLKCLIFIPIISRTYCDPKSYAWQHEFCAFNKLAKEDKFGRDIKLTGGNVASRILPIKIHDLDPEDKALLENEMGGVLRSVEFIYKSAGVNRPSRANEDHPQDNLNKTYYRDQINKVANAVKEIITALKKQSQHLEEDSKQNLGVKPTLQKNLISKIIIGVVITLILIILGIFFIPNLIKPTKQLEKSIAVLPFINDSPSDSNKYFINGIMEEVLNNLMKIKDFRVLSRTSTDQFKSTDRPTIPEIAKKLGVNYIVEGSGQKIGNTFILRVQLIAADKKEKHLWAERYEQEIKDVKDYVRIQSQIAQTIAQELKVTITPEEKLLLEKTPTNSLSAYNLYQIGREEYRKYLSNRSNQEAFKKAESYYLKTLEYDSAYAIAYSGLAVVIMNKYSSEDYLSENWLDSVILFCNKALHYDNKEFWAYRIRGDCYRNLGIPDKALDDYESSLKFNPSAADTYYAMANFYEDYDYIKSISCYQKCALLNQDPVFLAMNFNFIGNAFARAGFKEKAEHYAKEVLILNGDSAVYFSSLSSYEIITGNFTKSLEFALKSYELNSTRAYGILNVIANDYAILGQVKESLDYYQRYIANREARGILNHSSMYNIGYALWENGYRKEAEKYFDDFIEYCNKVILLGRRYSKSYDVYYDLAAVYAFKGYKEKAYEYLRTYNKNKKVISSTIATTFKINPFFNSIRNESEFQQIVSDVEAKYQAEHDRVKKWLEEQGMLYN